MGKDSSGHGGAKGSREGQETVEQAIGQQEGLAGSREGLGQKGGMCWGSKEGGGVQDRGRSGSRDVKGCG